ncbi:MAG TPA: rod shape-determining protein [Chthoniobacteraceae bacterium]|nr:rod shape-determining protein [Chthoniobacteraceae bacterium]
MSLFSNDIAISLADDSFLFSTREHPEPLVIPAYVAMQAGTNRALAYGAEAKAMLGKAPENITVVRVLIEGMPGNYEAALALLRHGMKKLHVRSIVRPRVIVPVPPGDPGNSAIKKMVMKHLVATGGAREVYLIDMGVATAIGMKLEIQKPELHAVLSVSDDWFEFTVISLSGVLASAGGAIGTKTFVEDARNHFIVSRQFKPDLQPLEDLLMSVGINAGAASAVQGWEVWTGKSGQGGMTGQLLSPAEITTGLMPSLVRITERIKNTIRSLTHEQQSDLARATIHATGSAMAIPGLAQTLANQLGMAVTPFPATVHPSIDGCRLALDELKFLRQVAPPKRR